MNLNPYLIYIKIGAAVALAAVLIGTGFHFGGLGPKAEMAELKAQQAKEDSNRSQAIATAVLAERASAEAQRERDHNTELTHARQIIQINGVPDITTPIVLCGPDEIHSTPLPSAEGQANSDGADTGEGRSVEVDRGRARRRAIEEVKKRLERIMADYRQEDAEWSKK